MSGISALLRRRVPSKNQNLEFYQFLKSDGVAYIRTDYYPQSYDELSCIFFKSSNESQFILGSRDTSRSLLFLPTNTEVYYSVFYKDIVSFESPMNYTINKLLIYNDHSTEGKFYRVVSYAGREVARVLVESSLASQLAAPLHLFSCNIAGQQSVDTRIMPGYIGEVIVKRDGRVIHQYTPCKSGTSVGLYDQITGKMYENANTQGAFSLHNQIEL